MSEGGLKRRAPRRAIGGVELLCYRTMNDTGHVARKNIGVEILDISPGGARLRLNESVRQGESLTVEIKDRKGGESFRAHGEVRWHEVRNSEKGLIHLVGVRFNEIYSTMGLRQRFTVGTVSGAPDVAEPLATRPEHRQSQRFEVADYVVSCTRQGTMSTLGLRRNVAREILDLSREGARVLVVEPLEPGTSVLFSLFLNKFADGFEVPADVRWCRPDHGGGPAYQVGLEFARISDENLRKVDFMRSWFTSHHHRYRKEQKQE